MPAVQQPLRVKQRRGLLVGAREASCGGGGLLRALSTQRADRLHACLDLRLDDTLEARPGLHPWQAVTTARTARQATHSAMARAC